MQVKIEKPTIEKIIKALSDGAEDHIRAGYLLGNTEGEEVIVNDVYVPEQTSTKAYATVGPKEVKEAFQAISDAGKKVVGFVQYNGPLPTFESPVTRETRENLSKMVGCEKLGIVVNAKGEHRIYF